MLHKYLVPAGFLKITMSPIETIEGLALGCQSPDSQGGPLAKTLK